MCSGYTYKYPRRRTPFAVELLLIFQPMWKNMELCSLIDWSAMCRKVYSVQEKVFELLLRSISIKTVIYFNHFVEYTLEFDILYKCQIWQYANFSVQSKSIRLKLEPTIQNPVNRTFNSMNHFYMRNICVSWHFDLPVDNFLWKTATKPCHYPIEAGWILHVRIEQEFDENSLFTSIDLFETGYGQSQKTSHGTRSQPQITCRCNICQNNILSI